MPIILFLVFLPFLVFADTKPVTKDYRISLKAENLTLTDIARSLSGLGIDVYIDSAEKNRVINVDIKDMPLEKAIKMLAYPLNYAIVLNERGEIKELRIFNTSTSPARGYVVFPSRNREKDNKIQSSASDSVVGSFTTIQDRVTNPSHDAERDKRNLKNDVEENAKLILEAKTLGGETAYAYNIWLNKRLAEMNSVTEQQRMYALKEMETAKANVNQIMNQMTKTNMHLTVAQRMPTQMMSGDEVQGDTKAIHAFYNYANEISKMMEAKRSQEIVNMQMKNFASYMYYQQKFQAGHMTTPYAAYQSYYQTMAIYKNLLGKK